MSDKRKAEISAKELKQKIKEAEARKRNEMLKNAETVNIVTPKGQENKVSFDEWWMVANKRANLKPWMKEIIRADFNARRLGKEEPFDTFDEGLRLFGVKL